MDELGSNGDSECQDHYRGPNAFSEIETQAIKAIIEEF